jgi:3-isopropylmalate dehydrogenase
MEKVNRIEGPVAPLPLANVDTDQVIRIDRLIEYARGELGPWCFEPLRYDEDGSERADFPPNEARYSGAAILLAGENFACGSSREAAVWALMDFGLRAVIAPSFSDIFRANAVQNGLLAILLPQDEVERLMAELDEVDTPVMTVDLKRLEITSAQGRVIPFEFDAERRKALMAGLDDVGLTLQMTDQIHAFQQRDRTERPWKYTGSRHEMKKLLLLAGDGIGPEIMAEVRRIVDWFGETGLLEFTLDEEQFGIDAWKAHGTLMRDETWAKIVAADAILFGAIGSPAYDDIPAEAKKPDRLLQMRRELDLYLNLRPVKVLSGLESASTLRPEVVGGADMLIVRELSSGIYFGEPRGRGETADGTLMCRNTMQYTVPEIERIARAAFELARTRNGRLCSVDKANVLETSALWREVVSDLHRRDYADVELTHMYVDNCAMQLVRNPAQFDVMVTENLFGDILSDCAAMVAGSLGMLPSASLSDPNAAGNRKALYEPIHGSAPDIAGQGIANPLGAIGSFALCLRHTFENHTEADRLTDAVQRVLDSGLRTADLAGGGKAVSTREMGDAVLAELDRSVETKLASGTSA